MSTGAPRGTLSGLGAGLLAGPLPGVFPGVFIGLAVGIAMLAWTWGTWPDVLIDFGGEIYVAWRLSQGDVLYRDLAYFTGPLSPYLNALVFRVFGTSLLTLVIANLAVLAGIAALLFRLVARCAGSFAAATALVLFFTLFAFAQFEYVGNSNYVCPYSHETTHGALLGLLALAALGRFVRQRATRPAAFAGVCLGLAFLTKVEVFLAIAAACGLALVLAFLDDRKGVGRAAAALLACAALPMLAAYALLATALAPAEAFEGLLGAWPYVSDERITSLAFYRWVMGTDDPARNLGELFGWAWRWIACFGLGAGAALLARGARSKGLLGFAAGGFAGGGFLLLFHLSRESRMEVGRPLPLFVLAALAGALWAGHKSREPGRRAAWILAACFALYALVLLSKMILHARVGMYGFALAMPAACVVALALLGWIPACIARSGGSAAVFRGYAVGAIGIVVAGHLAIQRAFMQEKTVRVGEGADAFLADRRGTYVNAALAALRPKLAGGGTLAVLPEGVMMNYLLRARTPARYINYMPPELLMFGEEAMARDFEASPPDFVAVAHKPTDEYGLPWFGVDYGARLAAFVRERYEPGPLLGQEPLRPETKFGIRLYARRR